jgi:dihydrodipicolinate synthase/N-acetylneuraminate lyase
MQKRFSGVVVPMITPLTDDFSIDRDAVKKIMQGFSANGLHPLILGTTGESSSIGENASLDLMAAAVEVKGQGQCIYAGLVGNQVEELIERGNKYMKIGADVIVATLPSYYILTPSQMINFYTTLAEKINGPVMMYNIKATTQMSIPSEVIHKLSQHPNIWGLKDSERDSGRLALLIQMFKNRPDFSFFCGWGAQSAVSLKLGADGIVPSTGNIVPELYRKLYQASLIGDYEKACKYQTETDKVAVLYQKGRTLGESLAALKVLMNIKGLCETTMMPPLSKPSDEDIIVIQKKFEDYI